MGIEPVGDLDPVIGQGNGGERFAAVKSIAVVLYRAPRNSYAMTGARISAAAIYLVRESVAVMRSTLFLNVNFTFPS